MRGACVAAWLSALLVSGAVRGEEPRPRVSFNREIRPILSDKCFACHGPDERQRKAELRLDDEASAKAERSGARAIVPGDVESSELAVRITAADPGERMPPAGYGKSLTAREIGLLQEWIRAGAPYEKHWSLIPPVRPALPGVRRAEWVRNPIDRFILARLEREGLSPSAEADPVTLLRRVSFDLTGLPPTPEEVERLQADDGPGAYERAVDRLLASPRYGERMAIRWLEAARYADTSGYQTDGERQMWRWRDWVIDAYNANMPFDQFTIEQLAGDLLPRPTVEQRIATGFNRNHRGNSEGGIIPEEYLVEYVVDRVETTATVWMGLTLGCARCHDHKFDPFTQREFYELFAFFNSIPERGRHLKYGNTPPLIAAPTPDQQRAEQEILHRIAAARARLAEAEPAIVQAQAAWEAGLLRHAGTAADWTVTRNQALHLALDGDVAAAASGAGAHAVAGNPESPAAGPSVSDGVAEFSQGRAGRAFVADGRRHIVVPGAPDWGYLDAFSVSAWVAPLAAARTPDSGAPAEGPASPVRGTLLSKMADVEQGEGWSVGIAEGRIQVHLVKRFLDDAVRVETADAVEFSDWRHLAVTYDGSRAAAGVRIWVDGAPVPLRVLLDELNQTFSVPGQPLRIAGGNGAAQRFHGLIDDVRLHNAALTPREISILASPGRISEIAARPAAARTPGESARLREAFVALGADASIRNLFSALEGLESDLQSLRKQFPDVAVMEELPEPRETYVLLRGAYDKPGERVQRATPAVLPPLRGEASTGEGRGSSASGASVPNRLDLARWLVAPGHPLTARVAVNRAWQLHFGTGLVRTVEDFGAQGEWPSHPELLDWLAVEFVESGWNVKALHRLIVTSAAYRQSSRFDPARAAADPDNRLLSRGPRQRLSAEMIRDQALLSSGLLVERIGGPSVRPYQPGELWKELASTEYVQDHGAGLYRRSLYTFWKRTIAPPNMLAFDAAGRETCIVRETRTNTPLQALTLLNETTYVEASRVLAERVARNHSAPRGRIAEAFQRVLTRRPSEAELAVLLSGYEAALAEYRRDPASAARLLQTGEAPQPADLDAAETAALAVVCNLLLNLDEAITKE